jgi:hypothetical protein
MAAFSGLAHGQVVPPFPSVVPADLYARTTAMRLVGNHSNTPYNNGFVDSTNNSANARGLQRAEYALTDVMLGFPEFTLQGGGAGPELDNPNAYTVVASIEYPIGSTPQRVYFQNGQSTSATINPGRGTVFSDPLELNIPAGAYFAVKCFVTWTGSMLFPAGASSLIFNFPIAGLPNQSEWTTRGIGLTDQTLTLTTFTNTTANQGFGPNVYGRTAPRNVVLGVIGDSIPSGLSDATDSVNASWARAISRAMRGTIPVFNNTIGGYLQAEFLTRPAGQLSAMRDFVTHVIVELGTNDLSAAASLATLQAQFQAIAEPWILRGNKVFGWPITPHTTSSNHWLDTASQAVLGFEAIRQGYNAWLRANWPALGLAGLIDAAAALETSGGLWNVDVGAALWTAGSGVGLYAVMSGQSVGSIINGGSLSNGTTVGAGYPNNTAGTWFAYPYPGDNGSGANGTLTSNGSGQILAASTAVTSGGAGYFVPPLINVASALTVDGLHPNSRGWNEIIYRTQLSPALFT